METLLKNKKIKGLSDILNEIECAVIIADLEGKIIIANNVAAVLNGYNNSSELVGHWVKELICEDEYSQFKTHTANCFKNKNGYGGKREYRLNRPDNKEVFIESKSLLFRDEDGEPEGFVSVLQDVTDRKHIEDALKNERYLFRTLMNNIPDAIYYKDKESNFIKINAVMAAKFYLQNPAEAIGKSDFDFFTEEHARPAFEDEQEIIKTGKPKIGIIEKETWANGNTSWVSTTKLLLKDENDDIIGTFGVSRDITELKNMEIEMQEAREKVEKRNKEIEEINSVLERSIERANQMAVEAEYANISKSELLFQCL